VFFAFERILTEHAIHVAGTRSPDRREKCTSGVRRVIREAFMRSLACLVKVVGIAAFVLSAGSVSSQPIDCARLAAEINALASSGQGHVNHYGAATQKQRGELDRAIRNARSLGCDRGQFFLFDTAPPQCQSLNAQIQQLQATLAQYEGNGDLGGNTAARQQLTARYNAYCRGQVQTSPRPQQRGFFETLFGVFQPGQNPFAPGQEPQFEEVRPLDGDELRPHGGSQAICVRTCDGGFFPLTVSARNGDPDQLTGLCQALCPNAAVSVYTRSPDGDISTAVSLQGDAPYSDLPAALKFQKSFDPACTCKPPGQTWAEALAGAEDLLGRARKSDVLVTPENSAELAKPKFEKAARPSPLPAPNDRAANNPTAAADPTGSDEIVGPDGVKRRVRIIVPPL
jgi:Protein of unknown function (DUF2865)